MEIPLEVQNKLKCCECNELLSCGPVYLLHETGGTICGRCSKQSEDASDYRARTRNEPYETTASLLAFPCSFATLGCPEKLKFSLEQPSHESTCHFRPFICPIAPRGSCDWIGPWSTLKKHCEEKHPLNILENPCNHPRPNISTSNLQTYLISAFNFLFLLHVKVCTVSGKLFHSVRIIGDLKLHNKFSYKLEIEGNNKKVIEYGSVFPAGIMIIQESTAINTTINSLLDLLRGRYDKSKFTITIEALLNFSKCLNCFENISCDSDSKFCKECAEELVKCDLNKRSCLSKCSNCFKNLDCNSNSKFCGECEAEIIKCKFNRKGCFFKELNKKKCVKHERYFCEYLIQCFWCRVNLVNGSFIEHLIASHKTTKSCVDSIVRVTPNTNCNFILFSSSRIDTIICQYTLYKSYIRLWFYTTLSSSELKNYKCSIQLIDPQTKYSEVLTPESEFYNYCDWSVNQKLNSFPTWQNVGIDIKVEIGEK